MLIKLIGIAVCAFIFMLGACTFVNVAGRDNAADLDNKMKTQTEYGESDPITELIRK